MSWRGAGRIQPPPGRGAALVKTLDVGAPFGHHGRVRAGVLASLGVVLLLPALGLAQVYRWQDERGIWHYTNTPERVPEAYRFQLGPLPPARVSPATPEESAPSPVTPALVTTRIPYTPGAPILVSARIGGTGSLTLILDTGADRTMVAPQALLRLGIAIPNAPRVEIRSVTGSAQGYVVQVASLEVGEAKAGPFRIIAHDAELKTADGVLGRDFLEHFTVTIDAKERLVTLVPK
jgi:predicted aspartyl protease